MDLCPIPCSRLPGCAGAGASGYLARKTLARQQICSALLCTSPRLPAGTTVPPQRTHPGTAQGTVWPLPTSWMWHYALYMVPQAETG